MQPETSSTAASAANRRTRLLRLRYLDEMEAPAVQWALAISRSTYQREHAVALRAIDPPLGLHRRRLLVSSTGAGLSGYR